MHPWELLPLAEAVLLPTQGAHGRQMWDNLHLKSSPGLNPENKL